MCIRDRDQGGPSVLWHYDAGNLCEEVWDQRGPVSYTHLDVYKRQSEDELRRDAFSLLKPYDDMSVEDINRFTKDDVVCALEMYNDCLLYTSRCV